MSTRSLAVAPWTLGGVTEKLRCVGSRARSGDLGYPGHAEFGGGLGRLGPQRHLVSISLTAA